VQSAPSAPSAFYAWLGGALALDAAQIARLDRYFKPRELTAETVLYREGDAADAIDIVARGEITVTKAATGGASKALRHMRANAVIGEMGFFRNEPRAGTVTASAGTTVFGLDRERFLEMQAQDPRMAQAFMAFVARALADRLAFANAEIAAVS
jgi:CRP-like cAMP-binding protein